MVGEERALRAGRDLRSYRQVFVCGAWWVPGRDGRTLGSRMGGFAVAKVKVAEGGWARERRLKAGILVPNAPAAVSCLNCCKGAAGGAGIPVPDAAAIGCCNCCQGAAGGAGIPVPNAPAISCCVCCEGAAGGAGIPVPGAAVIGCCNCCQTGGRRRGPAALAGPIFAAEIRVVLFW